MKKIKLTILSCLLLGIFVTPIVTQAAIIDYGSNVNIGGLFKYGVAWTQVDGSNGPARAKISLGGDVSDVTVKGYAQTEQISAWSTTTAYIGHGETTITTAYTK